MPILHVTTQSGETQDVEAADGTVMMEALRDAGLIEATCGGAASCGTCHVYFADQALTGQQTEDEGYMLEGLADFVEVTPRSRLACQVSMTAGLDGAKLTIAPEA